MNISSKKEAKSLNERTLAVQRMQEYIKEHIIDEITLDDLAKASLFSPWYSHRLFREYTGVAPSEYIRKLRLSEAAKKLKNETVNITDVAMSLGFKSLDGFTRAFFREFGMSPSKYKLKPVPNHSRTRTQAIFLLSFPGLGYIQERALA